MPSSNENVPKIEKEEIIVIGIDKIENFPNHPFKVVDESLDELKESINEYGITMPLIVRKKTKGKYELVSGHRRLDKIVPDLVYTLPLCLKIVPRFL